jgi:hypothetical protein
MQLENRRIRFLRTRAMRASENAASVRSQAESLGVGSMQDYLRRLAADYDRIANRTNELIRRDAASSNEHRLRRARRVP